MRRVDENSVIELALMEKEEWTITAMTPAAANSKDLATSSSL